MTHGVQAEYYSEPERQKKNFLELPDQTLQLIDTVRMQVLDAQTPEAIQDAVSALNSVLLEDGLLGRTAHLTSDFSVLVTRKLSIQNAQLQPVFAPETVSSAAFEGVFAGCDAVPFYDGRYELAYLMELPLDKKGLTMQSVVTPTDMATLSVELASLPTMEDVDKLGESLAILSKIDDPEVRSLVSDMIDAMDASEETDAALLRELAILGTAILEYDSVSKDLAAKNALSRIFASLIDEGAVYALEGIEFAAVKTEKGNKISLDEMEVRCELYAAATVSDFDFTPAGKDGTPAVYASKPNLQPAFVVLDDDGVEHVFPIKWIKTFYVSEYSADDASCDAARSNFLDAYPDIFDKKKKHKRDRFIVEKYFQKDDGGV